MYSILASLSPVKKRASSRNEAIRCDHFNSNSVALEVRAMMDHDQL